MDFRKCLKGTISQKTEIYNYRKLLNDNFIYNNVKCSYCDKKIFNCNNIFSDYFRLLY